DEEARAVMLVRRVIVHDQGRPARVDRYREEVRHAAVPVARCATESFLANLAEMHRMLRRTGLVDRRARGGAEVELDLGQVDMPPHRRGCGAVRKPRGDRPRTSPDGSSVTTHVDDRPRA